MAEDKVKNNEELNEKDDVTTETKTNEEVKEEKAEEEKEEIKEESELEKLQKELASQKEKYIRLMAEYDNYRKRTQGEKLNIYDDATAKAVEELLPIADSITMALSQFEDKKENENFIKGIMLIYEQLKKSFEKLKITDFGEIGEEFDPQFHNAVSKIEDENAKKNTISAVFQKGFKIKDKIIRHAMVQVANCE